MVARSAKGSPSPFVRRTEGHGLVTGVFLPNTGEIYLGSEMSADG